MVAPLRSDNAVISVVIPSYNRKNFLRKALESVLNQTLQAHEILVVDDGSNDHTITDLSSDFPTVTWLRQENAGVSTRNHGIRKSPGMDRLADSMTSTRKNWRRNYDFCPLNRIAGPATPRKNGSQQNQ